MHTLATSGKGTEFNNAHFGTARSLSGSKVSVQGKHTLVPTKGDMVAVVVGHEIRL